MKKLILSLLMLGYGLHLSAQKLNADLLGTSQPTIQSKLTVNNRAMDEGDETSLDPMLKPFYHGVASGDPLSDRVIIWTRITPEEEEDSISVSWKIATDTAMENIISSGEFQTSSSRDYTVKVDVTGLSADTYYYYEFESGGRKSLVGRAKTASEGTEDHLKFAVVSCSNYEAGYFNAYGRIADRNDLDAVLHLGDYIYEYETSVYGDSSLSNAGIRAHQGFETVSVDQYRARYSLYRLDKDLRRAHQQHSFICVWDDHESANDAYKDGAENHQPDEEGDWEERKEMARKAYYEWIPIREQESDVIYRSFSYGDLLDLIMLDTRLEGREIQRDSVTDPLLYAPDRTMLGTTQRDWFFGEMGGSSASWKLIGNQVVFSEFNVGWAADPTQGQTPNDVEALFLDIWDGYPQERQIIIDYIRDQEVDNVIMVTGDIHSSFAFEVADTVNDPSALYAPVDNY
ncbi:MAG: alkaline phosphatase D family protein, partial [Bacteroidota bacterium]